MSSAADAVLCLLLAALCLVCISSAPEPPDGNSIALILKGRGLQIYKCSSSSWTLDRAEAELYPDVDTSWKNLVGFHYFLPKPDAGGGRATWALQSRDQKLPTGTVTGKVLANRSSNEAGTIDQLLLQATSHSGGGTLGKTSYIQRVANKGGAAPPLTECSSEGLLESVAYESTYVFWEQQVSDEPSYSSQHRQLEKVKDRSSPVFIWFAEGTQNYEFNGTAWSLANVSALLFTGPGQPAVAKHYFGGDTKLPTWETLRPTFLTSSSVTAKPVAITKPATTDAIAWVDLHTTSTSGDIHGLDAISFVQRRSTRGGLPPSFRSPKVGDEHKSPYTAVYWFYSSGNTK